MEKYLQFHALRSIHQLILTFTNEFGLVIIINFGDCEVQHKSPSIKHMSHHHYQHSYKCRSHPWGHEPEGPGLPAGHVVFIMIRLLSPSQAPAQMVASLSSLSSTLTPRDPGVSGRKSIRVLEIWVTAMKTEYYCLNLCQVT